MVSRPYRVLAFAQWLPLALAGELLDVDGVTGGHNFQSCWTTGMVAGTEAAKVALALRRRPERDGSAPPLPEH